MDARTISASELAKHTAEDDCWIAIHGKVYNVTNYLLDHPGGLDVMMDHSGVHRF
jgi:cytochrome b involved in lipid metabolism